jgi:enoyl-CoA hydratase/carnithine racemase/3-hydroxyacyl-CoA dehydrogenase
MTATLSLETLRQLTIVGSGEVALELVLFFSRVLSRRGCTIAVVEKNADALERFKTKLSENLRGEKSEKAKLMEAMITFSSDSAILSDADWIIEATGEDPAEKREALLEIEKLAPEHAPIASQSTRAIPEDLFGSFERPSRTLVLHHHLPVYKNMVVEVVPGAGTDPNLVRQLLHLYERMGKAPIRATGRWGHALEPIRAGLLVASALLADRDMATPAEIDEVACKTLRMRTGPFAAAESAGGMEAVLKSSARYAEQIMPWFGSVPHEADWIPSARRSLSGGEKEEAEPEKAVIEPEKAEVVSIALQGAYFGLACEAVSTGVIALGDLELGIELGLGMRGPFGLMNKMGVRKALEAVQTYAAENPGFAVADLLKEQAAVDAPWTLPLVLREDRDEIAIVKIRRPKALNALNREVMGQIEAVFDDLKADPAIRGVILTGFGTKVFVAGADINELARIETPEQAESLALRGQGIFSKIEHLGKPVICALNGLAFGGGNEMAMACLARLAVKGTKMLAGQPEPKLGIIPGYGGTQRLPRLIGLRAAWPILRTGNPISSAQALELGLIREEVEGDLIEAAKALLRKVLSGEVTLQPIRQASLEVPEDLPEVDIGHLSRKTDELIQKAVLEGARTNLEEGLRIEARTFGECFLTRDVRIGLENFLKFGPRSPAKFIHA